MGSPVGAGEVVPGLRLDIGELFARDKRPDALQRQHRLDGLGQPVVALLDHAHEVIGVPQPDLEEEPRRLLLDGLLEPSERYEQTLLGAEVLHDSLELAQHLHIRWSVARLHLDREPRRIEAKWSTASNNVDSAVRAGRRQSNLITLRLQDFGDEFREGMTPELRARAIIT